jgi:hypothetical protein
MSQELRDPTGVQPGSMTYEDYCGLPDDGLRYEVIDGLLFAEPSPRTRHQRAAANLHLILGPHDGAYRVPAAVAGDEVLTSPLFPDLRIPVPELWR